MGREHYYVSVQANSILTNQAAAAYELEIIANKREVEEIQELFDSRIKAEDHTFFRAMTPAIPYHLDEDNDNYDYYLIEIYKKLYELGTTETKSHIEKMNILSKA